ncbi:zf-TFIIB domain-containing protein [Crenobacter cavernae]|uniref:Transcription factor zinc-finger domain-containing protein n=1 Tax=Crenobacter cavernae TaxID=2290923 RepID=A0A345Y421_9NEIS|nr:zf-TFIIB domain-containing protein [Crenobacter cavernae]AXK38673.1 hypothetical protein DWG20_04090 [Crenobacter cavernae]
MKCPVCPDATLVMSERQGIEIDYCPQCRGVWLDRGELDKIIERSPDDAPATQPASQAQPRHPQPDPRYPSQPASYHHDDRHQHGKHGHRRKSFWEELFD